MEKSIRITYIKLLISGLAIDAVILFVFYLSFNNELTYAITIVGGLFLVRHVSSYMRFKHRYLSVRNGTIFWEGNPCDVEIERFIYNYNLKLSYMNGPNLKTVHIPRNALSRVDWVWLTEYRI